MRAVRLRSLAKINLDLRVLHKRADGFHELRTIFQTISLADTIEIEYQPGRTKVELKSNIEIPANLVLKATDLVLGATKAKGQLRMRLTKRIPLGSGLGGGSSNAASVLLALPVLLKRPIKLEKMLDLASQLGSDVPFFVLGGSAVGLGRGTELYPLPDISPLPGIVVASNIHSSTSQAYAALNRPVSDGASSAAPDPQSPVNDFETVVFREHPQLKSIKGKLLKLGAGRAMMTGSGSAVFGLFPNRELRDGAAERFRQEFPGNQVFQFTMVSRGRYRSLWRRQLAVSSESKTWPPQERYAK
jgi:4-diphosphocytidyl-2-C-methyl-D-erythritol kinase